MGAVETRDAALSAAMGSGSTGWNDAVVTGADTNDSSLVAGAVTEGACRRDENTAKAKMATTGRAASAIPTKSPLLRGGVLGAGSSERTSATLAFAGGGASNVAVCSIRAIVRR